MKVDLINYLSILITYNFIKPFNYSETCVYIVKPLNSLIRNQSKIIKFIDLDKIQLNDYFQIAHCFC